VQSRPSVLIRHAGCRSARSRSPFGSPGRTRRPSGRELAGWNSPTMTEPFVRLVSRWREEAQILRRYGDANQAVLLEECASQIEAAWCEYLLEELSVEEAALESGYSLDRLRALVRQGEIPDRRQSGTQSKLRIRRGDLPRRPGLTRTASTQVSDIAGTLLTNRT
jgi:hypothetical protein